MEVSSVLLHQTSPSVTVPSSSGSIAPASTDSVRSEDLLAIVSLALRLDIPHTNLKRQDGVRVERVQLPPGKEERVAYALGSGATCIVTQHEVDEVIHESVPKGTVVALKRYIEQASLVGDEQARHHKRLFRLVWQDLRVLSHPFLRTHEHISKLLFLGWDDNTIVPAFAMELARYGTLEQLLLSSGSALSDVDKANISLDITIGVAALHGCDLIHGDIKPSNIIIQHSDTRRVVAKLSDFAGADTVVDYGGPGHQEFGTPIWSAPEVVLRRESIDWQKADVYSLGLVIVHLWWPAQNVGTFFLDSVLPKDLDRDEKLSRIMAYKVGQSDGSGPRVIEIFKVMPLLVAVKEKKPRNPGDPYPQNPNHIDLFVSKSLAEHAFDRPVCAELVQILCEMDDLGPRRSASQQYVAIILLLDARGSMTLTLIHYRVLRPPASMFTAIEQMPTLHESLGRDFVSSFYSLTLFPSYFRLHEN
jgi:serine/threonine protein kinase